MPIRFPIKNNIGKPTYITKLYSIAYVANAPGTMVKYDDRLADNINSGPFRRRKIAAYMKASELKKPTLVKKSADGQIFVLGNDTVVKTILIQNIPQQFHYLYIDKTN